MRVAVCAALVVFLARSGYSSAGVGGEGGVESAEVQVVKETAVVAVDSTSLLNTSVLDADHNREKRHAIAADKRKYGTAYITRKRAYRTGRRRRYRHRNRDRSGLTNPVPRRKRKRNRVGHRYRNRTGVRRTPEERRRRRERRKLRRARMERLRLERLRNGQTEQAKPRAVMRNSDYRAKAPIRKRDFAVYRLENDFYTINVDGKWLFVFPHRYEYNEAVDKCAAQGGMKMWCPKDEREIQVAREQLRYGEKFTWLGIRWINHAWRCPHRLHESCGYYKDPRMWAPGQPNGSQVGGKEWQPRVAMNIMQMAWYDYKIDQRKHIVVCERP